VNQAAGVAGNAAAAAAIEPAKASHACYLVTLATLATSLPSLHSSSCRRWLHQLSAPTALYQLVQPTHLYSSGVQCSPAWRCRSPAAVAAGRADLGGCQSAQLPAGRSAAPLDNLGSHRMLPVRLSSLCCGQPWLVATCNCHCCCYCCWVLLRGRQTPSWRGSWGQNARLACRLCWTALPASSGVDGVVVNVTVSVC
jgi:hypothetical protein